MLNSFGEGRHPCLIPVFSGKGLNFSSIRIRLTCVLAVNCLYWDLSLISIGSPGFSSKSDVRFYQWPLLCLIRLSCYFYHSSLCGNLLLMIGICWSIHVVLRLKQLGHIVFYVFLILVCKHNKKKFPSLFILFFALFLR